MTPVFLLIILLLMDIYILPARMNRVDHHFGCFVIPFIIERVNLCNNYQRTREDGIGLIGEKWVFLDCFTCRLL